jgi:hypothetical protein
MVLSQLGDPQTREKDPEFVANHPLREGKVRDTVELNLMSSLFGPRRFSMISNAATKRLTSRYSIV